MLDLQSCILKGYYDSNFDVDIVGSFYIPCLSNASYYDRMAGFFTSSSLSAAARGISKFIEHGGKMRLVVSPYLQPNDIKVFSDYVNNPEELRDQLGHLLEEQINEEFIANESTQALGWMLLNDFLEIHIAVILDSNGELISAEEIIDSGMFHNKVGILRDDNENVVAFSGSINETYYAWGEINIESFDVFCSWEDSFPKHIQPKIEHFERYWGVGQTNRILTLELPEAVKNKWIKTVPSSLDQLMIFNKRSKQIKLRDYQENAINCWRDNDYHGIFNMATGTGKTFTAIFAIKYLLSDLKGKAVLVIAVPFQHLVEDPWIKSLSKIIDFENRRNKLIRAYGNSSIWHKEAMDAKISFRLHDVDLIAIVTTYSSLSLPVFTDFIQGIKGDKILVADEVHNAGSEVFRNGLLEEYRYRLGLSATPSRYLDDEGTQFLINFFEKEVYTFTLAQAINTINPDTGETFLTPYDYHPIFVSLSLSELEDYNELSKKIAKVCPDEDPTPSQIEMRNRLLIKRSRILKNASNKLNVMSNLIPNLKKEGFFDHTLIYCSDGRDAEDNSIKTLNRVISILNSNEISSRKFTFEEDSKERRAILSSFTEGSISTLVAIKCLDEGVDVPSTRNAIIMASSGNPREYIQRRGRILRRSPGKEKAVLYDFIIIPQDNSPYPSLEANIFNNEYQRFKEFADLSLNRDSNYSIIKEIISKYNLDV